MMLIGIPKCTQTLSKKKIDASCTLTVILQGMRMHMILTKYLHYLEMVVMSPLGSWKTTQNIKVDIVPWHSRYV